MQEGVANGNYIARSDIKDYKAWTWTRSWNTHGERGLHAVRRGSSSKATPWRHPHDSRSRTPSPATSKGITQGRLHAAQQCWHGPPAFFARDEKSDYGVETGGARITTRRNSVGANYYLDGQKLKVSFENAVFSFDTEHPTNPPALQDIISHSWQQFVF